MAFRRKEGGRVTSVVYEQDGVRKEEPCDVLVSSMPIKDLVAGMEGVPEGPARIAAGLSYRDYVIVGVLAPTLLLKNRTKTRALGGIVPDTWIYVHDGSVKTGRFQIYNNWSPYLVQDPEHRVFVGLEYFCNEGDALWSMPDADFARLGVREMAALGLIASEADALDTHVERVRKAYPAYFDAYAEFPTLRAWLDTVPNLYCIGRNGQHRYSNIDHCMRTAFEAVRAILAGSSDRSRVWDVSTALSLPPSAGR